MINFFCSGEHAEAWGRAHSKPNGAALDGAVLSVEEATLLGRELWGKLQDAPGQT